MPPTKFPDTLHPSSKDRRAEETIFWTEVFATRVSSVDGTRGRGDIETAATFADAALVEFRKRTGAAL